MSSKISQEQKLQLVLQGGEVVKMAQQNLTEQQMLENAFSVENKNEREALLFALGNYLGYIRGLEESKKV